MNKYTTAILITTFLRDSLLYKTLQTIVDNQPKDCIVLIADQGYSDNEKEINIDYFKSQIQLQYYQLPFDCGLSYARNFLINKAKELNIPYILMGADSIQFTEPYDFTPFINILKSDPNLGIVGFNLINSKCPWEFTMEITPKGIRMNPPREYITINGIEFQDVDICRNIFLGKTDTLINLYDNDMKLAEHELAFLEYKKRGFKVYWTNKLIFKKVVTNTSEEYQNYRKRFNDYKKLIAAKLGIDGWVTYSPEVIRQIKAYKERNT